MIAIRRICSRYCLYSVAGSPGTGQSATSEIDNPLLCRRWRYDDDEDSEAGIFNANHLTWILNENIMQMRQTFADALDIVSLPVNVCGGGCP